MDDDRFRAVIIVLNSLILMLLVLLAYFAKENFTIDKCNALSGADLASPKIRINESRMSYRADYNGGLMLCVTNISDFWTSGFLATHSMEACLDSGMTGLWQEKTAREDIIPGDIISFWSGNESDRHTVAHRVVSVGYDDKGWYAVTKGDNNWVDDGKVRWFDVEAVLVGVIY